MTWLLTLNANTETLIDFVHSQFQQNLFKQDNHVFNNADKKRKAVYNSTMNRKEEEKKKNMKQQIEIWQITVSVKSAVSFKM